MTATLQTSVVQNAASSTPNITLDTSGNVAIGKGLGVGASPSYGTSGQPLLSGGAGSAPTYGTLGTSAGGTGLTTVGTNGQVLQSNGSTLSWATPSSGAMTLISTQTASFASSITFTGLSNSYFSYVIIGSNLTGSPAGTVVLSGQVSTDNGSTIRTASYYYRILNINSGSNTYSSGGGSNSTYGQLMQGALPTSTGSYLKVELYGFGGSNYPAFLCYGSTPYDPNAGSGTEWYGGNGWAGSSANAFQINSAMSGGSFSGTFKLYGISS